MLNRTREPEYRKAFPADHADVKIAALMTWLNPWIPARCMPMTQGLAFAFDSGLSKFGSVDGTRAPRIKLLTP
jgi:hypothetical protein